MSLIAFKKDPKLTYVYINGCGNVTSKTILFGEKYLKYVGKGLVPVDVDTLSKLIESKKEKEGINEVVVLDELPQVELDSLVEPLEVVASDEIEFKDLEQAAPKKKGGRPSKKETA